MLRTLLTAAAMSFTPAIAWCAEPVGSPELQTDESQPIDPVTAALDAREWDTACELLANSWVEPAKPRVAAQRALCLFHLGDFVASARLASFALEGAESHELRTYRERLAQLYRQAKSKIGLIELRVEHEGATLFLDGEAHHGTKFFVTTGDHQVEVRAEGFTPQIRTFSLEAGETIHATITLEPEPSPDSIPRSESPPKSTTPLLIGGGVGAVAAIGGTVTLILAAGSNSRAKELRTGILAEEGTCSGAAPHADCEALADRERGSKNLGTASAVTYGVGIAGIIAGTAWYLLQPSPAEVSGGKYEGPIFELNSSAAMLSWSGRF